MIIKDRGNNETLIRENNNDFIEHITTIDKYPTFT